MLCSAKELALADDAEGLLILPADAPVGKKFSDYLPGDTLFEVEVTSNRPDLLSYKGIAREIAAIGAGSIKVHPLAPRALPHGQAGVDREAQRARSRPAIIPRRTSPT